MKKLIFIRHAKAEDQSAEISDFERSLTIKGKMISKQTARKLKETEKSPGIMITSPAFRALETAIIFAGEFGIAPENIQINSNLYFKMNSKYLREILDQTNEDSDSITLFGHNPSFSELADSLCNGGCDFLPKCGVIGISFIVTKWQEIKHGTGRIEYFLKPEKFYE
jgi:phosphohistidine phosphatase